jgi:hypothetical protein
MTTALVATSLVFAIPCTAAAEASHGKPSFAGWWSDTHGIGTQQRKPRRELAAQLPLTKWGRDQVTYTTSADGAHGGEIGAASDPRYHRACGGPESPTSLAGALEIYQSADRLLVIYPEGTHPWLRRVWIGREHPKDLTDYNPTWMGHSVAKWDGDVLVVDTVGIREGSLVDQYSAAPQSGHLHLIERFQLLDGGKTLRIDRTYEDPVAYTKPWSNSKTYKLRSDWHDIADEWEVGETHMICEGGRYPRADDPWFDDYDQIKKQILPNYDTLEKGPPPRSRGAATEKH